jgi:hypothetical protein
MNEWAAGSVVRPYPEDERSIAEHCEVEASGEPARKNNRGLPGRLRATNIHSEPSIVNRLIRMVEELLERDDVTPDADPTWYRNRLQEIRREIADAEGSEEPGGSSSGEAQEEGPADPGD